MRYLLDTNVLSEPARPEPNPHVLTWLEDQSQIDLVISVLTLGEIEQGIELLRAGPKRDRLREWVEVDLPRRFRDRILPVDERVARAWGHLAAQARMTSRPIPVIDGLLLATASAYDLVFVTRNDADCANRGVPTVNPWLGP